MNTTLAILVCALIAIASCAPQEKFLELKKKCMQQSGATDEMVMNAHMGKFSGDTELKNFFFCVGKAEGIIDDDGQVHKDVFKSKLMMFTDNESAVDSAIDKCVVEKSTPEETALESTICVFGELKK